MNTSGVLGRTGTCPQCGGELSFPFASALAQVCKYCRFVIVRTDRAWEARGKVADLVAIASPLWVGGTGRIVLPPTPGQVVADRVRIAGRVQYDRADAPSAPWQEFFVHREDGSWVWLAQAQGHWYLSAATNVQHVPSFEQATLGTTVQVPGWPPLVVAERGLRRLLSAEGELPFPIVPGEIERYVDLSGPSGSFATIDYGDGRSPPVVFAGWQIDPSIVRMDAPPPTGTAEPTVSTASLTCPGCGGPLPLAVPNAAQRIVCSYCGMQSDVTRGALQALRKVERPLTGPRIALGATGNLRGEEVICIGFMVRGTTIEDERYRWREYLLYSKTKSRYLWLVEEDGAWQYIVSVAPGYIGLVTPDRREVTFGNVRFRFVQSVAAEVEHVLGEFYWKVEVGERVQATEYRGPDGTVLNEERSGDEVVWSHALPASWLELKKAFSISDEEPLEPAGVPRFDFRRDWWRTWCLLLGTWLVITLISALLHGSRVVFDDTAVFARTSPATGSNTSTPISPLQGLSPAASEAFFTPPFKIERSHRSLLIELEMPYLSNSWAGYDIALVEESTGEVREAAADLEYYSGSSGGESWSEGSNNTSLWFSQLEPGTYFLRVEGTWDPAQSTAHLHMRATHDTLSGAHVFVSLGLLLLFLIGGTVGAAMAAQKLQVEVS